MQTEIWFWIGAPLTSAPGVADTVLEVRLGPYVGGEQVQPLCGGRVAAAEASRAGHCELRCRTGFRIFRLHAGARKLAQGLKRDAKNGTGFRTIRTTNLIHIQTLVGRWKDLSHNPQEVIAAPIAL